MYMKSLWNKFAKSIWFYYVVGMIVGAPIGVIAYKFNWLG